MDNNKILIAVSGGPDSMAVLDISRRKGLEIAVGHVNYKKRLSAERDQRIVEDYCKKYGIPCYVSYYQAKEDQGNFQKNARDFRYNFFKKLQKEHGFETLYVGHHKDDDLETYLFQKERQMLSDHVGLAKSNNLFGFTVYRPLLEKNKEEIIAYCHQYKVPYGIDETNMDTEYTRNKLRRKIQALNPEEYNQLYETLMVEKENWKKKQKEISKIVKSWDLVIPLKTYVRMEDVDRILYLRKWLINHGVKAYDFSTRYLEEIDRTILEGEANYKFENINLVVTYDELALFHDCEYEYIMDSLMYIKTNFFKLSDQGKKIESITFQTSDFPIKIRNYKQGDKIEMKFGTKKVSRYFIDRKIPVYKRYTCPVIENAQGQIIFVSGLGPDKRHYSNNPDIFMIEL